MVKSKGDILFNIFVYIIIFSVGLICLIPVLFVISASVTPYSELLKNGGFVLIPRKFTNVAYVEMLADGALSHAMWVTIKLTVIATNEVQDDLMQNVISGMLGDSGDGTTATSIEAKSLSYSTITMSAGSAILWSIVLVILVPVGLLLTGFVIWFTRRRK